MPRKANKVHTIIYVDYENVSNSGIDGIERLSSGYEVRILYSSHADTMRIPYIQMVINTKAKVSFIEVCISTMNALDFQLITDLYSNIKKGIQYYIVSKDKGYDAAIERGKALGLGNVDRIACLDELLPIVYDDEIEEDVPKEVKSPTSRLEGKDLELYIFLKDWCHVDLNDNEVELIAASIRNAELSGGKTMSKFYMYLVQTMGQSRGLQLYNSVKKQYLAIKGIVMGN